MTDDVAAILGDAPAVDGQALERVRRIGGSALIERMIASFLGHVPGRVDEVVRAEEAPAAMRAAHAIKSSAGNLGLARLARLRGIDRRGLGLGRRHAERFLCCEGWLDAIVCGRGAKIPGWTQAGTNASPGSTGCMAAVRWRVSPAATWPWSAWAASAPGWPKPWRAVASARSR